jgi:hypothetical protein
MSGLHFRDLVPLKVPMAYANGAKSSLHVTRYFG